MPGVAQMSVDVAADWLSARAEAGYKAFIAFGVIERAAKDASGSAACDADNVICRLLREVKKRQIPMAAITDLCMCEYTDHGHCGPLTADRSTVDNDATLELLVKQAINHADAGADVIAPSGMMDGTVGALRRGARWFRAPRRRDHGVCGEVRECILWPVPRRRRFDTELRRSAGISDGSGSWN